MFKSKKVIVVLIVAIIVSLVCAKFSKTTLKTNEEIIENKVISDNYEEVVIEDDSSDSIESEIGQNEVKAIEVPSSASEELIPENIEPIEIP